MPFVLTETFVYSVFGIIVVGTVCFSIWSMRHDEKNKNNPELHRRNMWLSPLTVWLCGGGMLLKYDDLTARVVTGLLLILFSYVGYRIHAKKLKQSLEAQNTEDGEGNADSYEQKQKVSTAVATIAVAGCLGIIYVAIRAFAADGGEQIKDFSNLEDGIFSSNTKLISTIGMATGVIVLLFLLLTGAIGKIFAIVGIKKEYKSWGGKIKTGQLYVRKRTSQAENTEEDNA